MLLNKEEFEHIEEYPDYLISSQGKVVSLKYKKPRLLKPSKLRHGYLSASLGNRDGFKHKTVHRLVAIAFISNPENKKQVNHRDGDKENNHIENLEWVSNGENQQHAYDNGMKPNARAVKQYSLEGSYMKTFKSSNEVERELNIGQQNISKACKGIYGHAGGFQWRYEGDNTVVSEYKKRPNGNGRRVAKLDDEGKIVKTYNSVAEACEDTGWYNKFIRDCCLGYGNKKTKENWKYLD